VTAPGTAPRLAPLPREQWTDDVVAAFRAGIPGAAADRFLSDGPDALRMPNALATMVHNPALAEPWLRYNDVLLRHASIDARLRELMILRVAWLTRSEYEWVQHVRLAPRYDITPGEIQAISRGASAGCWTPLETALLAATDQLMDGYRIDDATWKALAGELDERQLIEVVYVVGTYTCLAMVFKSLGVQLDPELRDVPAPALPQDAQ
jgi:alkylhydroperoxidase family enzyme